MMKFRTLKEVLRDQMMSLVNPGELQKQAQRVMERGQQDDALKYHVGISVKGLLAGIERAKQPGFITAEQSMMSSLIAIIIQWEDANEEYLKQFQTKP